MEHLFVTNIRNFVQACQS